MNKTMASKLADSLRQAREKSSLPISAGTVSPLPVVSPPPVSRPRATPPRARRFARQSDQSPPASPYSPWDDLHPERIWPD